ncbi:hypothetical protein BDY19DRAFT_985376 [Irpex rosettiformis]|uniref:Uncharacterized protein n=1 Tax=Irpex rosettiformis TaxID=378272 RepID=A0ACB8U456_9APHY|nr:hypothetical protein BDY19DRAFT_985376 [Irpex rosettiformis]
MTDNPLVASYAMNTALEDFFNFDMLSGPSAGNASGSSSRSSSNSPSQSFAALPPTPPNPFETTVQSDNGFFEFYLNDDVLAKASGLPPTSAAPFDFMGAFPPVGLSSPEGGFSGTSPSSGDSPVTIDPQLMDTPSSLSKSHSEFGDEEGDDEDDKDDDDDDEPIIAAIKVGGKGRDRKGTVQSGGIVKKSLDKKEGMLSTTSMDPDDWRPTPEEYKKMSSKEKRQLRNKISARNFRYITTLEGDIAERDRLIEAIRGELGSTKSENLALRQEISALKKALLDGRGRIDTPVLPPPAPLPAVSAALAASALKSPPPTPKSPLLAPNVHKDLPTSPRLAGRGFWGGSLGSGIGGITPVHTTLVPDLSSVLSGKPVGRKSPALQENINPMLNGQPLPEKTMELSLPVSAFDSFTDLNPFTMKSIDAYRMQLWTRMGQQQAAYQQRQPQGQTSSASKSTPPPLSGLASGLRPHYFAKNATLSGMLSGKSASNAYPTPPASPALHPSNTHNHKVNAQQSAAAQQAMLASMASQTLCSKLGSAFWDAFSGEPSNRLGSSRSAWDAEKVRKVLEGKAVVRVVDVEPKSTTTSTPAPVDINEKIASPRLSARSPPLEPTKARSLDKMLEGLCISKS